MFQEYQAIALLSANMIETAVESILQESLSKFKEFATFRDLAKEALKLDNIPFAPFVDYFHKEWIKTVTPKHFCVYQSSWKCSFPTGNVELCNGKLNRVFKAHPGFYLFCETLQKMEVSHSNQLMN